MIFLIKICRRPKNVLDSRDFYDLTSKSTSGIIQTLTQKCLEWLLIEKWQTRMPHWSKGGALYDKPQMMNQRTLQRLEWPCLVAIENDRLQSNAPKSHFIIHASDNIQGSIPRCLKCISPNKQKIFTFWSFWTHAVYFLNVPDVFLGRKS